MFCGKQYCFGPIFKEVVCGTEFENSQQRTHLLSFSPDTRQEIDVGMKEKKIRLIMITNKAKRK